MTNKDEFQVLRRFDECWPRAWFHLRKKTFKLHTKRKRGLIILPRDTKWSFHVHEKTCDSRASVAFVTGRIIKTLASKSMAAPLCFG